MKSFRVVIPVKGLGGGDRGIRVNFSKWRQIARRTNFKFKFSALFLINRNGTTSVEYSRGHRCAKKMKKKKKRKIQRLIAKLFKWRLER